MPLFSQLKETEVLKPLDPVETQVKYDKGKETSVLTKFDEILFLEKVKEWITYTKSPKATHKSLYNIVWE